jgi:geranylgeranyl diphosphate synthase, type II
MSQTNLSDKISLPPRFLETLALHQSQRLSHFKWPEPTSSLAAHALSGGKFLRPQLYFLILASFDSHSIWSPSYYDVALSVEWIHAYSLIHDDLPCMDNDDFRRGRPTLHRLSNDAQALLVGDALLTAAFELLSRSEGIRAEVRLALVQELSFAAGGAQLIAGQVRDLNQSYTQTVDDLLHTHVLKTGALFGAAAAMAALSVTSKNLAPKVSEFRNWGRDFGILYQLIDDFADRDGVYGLMEPEKLRKEIIHRMESLRDRARALGWSADEIIERFAALIPYGN